ncbi:methyltransferase domain-containing protein [uncultured Paludibaculum sp.]|uniref:class I SAM-dependent methyltransferase n=1 Tax=uncultured Paludibaculum sp. TaxID=1765020 RepID=UPI002AAC4171|nr:methyltransferase domain-containing protein [uncultured Paludibaculum sp.]
MSWTARRWDLYAPYYDRLIGFVPHRRRSLALAELRPGERLLVDGCGTGLDLPLIPAEVEVEAIDLSPGMVEQALSKGTAARVRTMDAQQLEFADATFDCVLLHLIVAIVPDPLRCLREAARVVKPGGRVMVFDKYFHGTGRPRLIRRVLNPLMRFLVTDLNVRTLDLAVEAGFRVVHDEPAMLNGMFRIARLELR